MRPVRSSGPRLRAVVLVLVCLSLATGATFAKTGSKVPLAGAPDQAAADVVHVARNQVGDTYAWGGNGPDAWDCSGLTSLWKTVGGAKTMPRVSRDQQAWAVPIPREQALIGDLVFFGHPVTHVGIVVGGGRMVDAAESRKGVVERAIWTTGVVRYGRVPRPGMPKVTPWTPPPLPSPLPAAPVADSPEAAAGAPRSAAAPVSPKPVATPPKPAATPAKPAAASKPAAPKPAAPQPATAKPSAPKPAAPAAKPVAPAAKPVAAPAGLAPLQGLPGVQRAPSSAVALKAAANAKATAGRPAGPGGWSDAGLVATAWRHAGGQALPADRQALVARGKPVPLADARVGDVVVYNKPATHLGVYLGHGYMADASTTNGRVMVRRVYASGFAGLVRLG